MNAIEVRGLEKHYPGFALKGIDLDVPQGAVVGLVGENGAGKTTLIKLLLNTARRDGGEIRLLGKDLLQHEKELKEQIGVVLDGSFFPETLNVTDIEKIMRCFYPKWDRDRFLETCRRFDLPFNKAIKNFSKGMRMKLAIACALCHHAKLLILDEPTSGLDPVIRSEILEMFRDFIQEEEHTILISSHIISDLEHIADYIAFIDHGEIALVESYETLCSDYGILRCDEELFSALDEKERLRWRKNRYSVDVLVKNVQAIRRRYPDAVIDCGNIEELLLLFVKGEKAK